MFFGCHLSISDGFFAMGQTAISLGATTLQFFTRNPRGSRAKTIDSSDVDRFLALCRSYSFGPIIAHAPYTLNPCSSSKDTRAFAKETMLDDLERLRLLPNALYNFHPGSHVGQGLEAGIRFISETLNEVFLQSDGSTTVLLETMSGKGSEIGSQFEQLREIIDRVVQRDRLGVCLDTCHVWDAGYDIADDLDGVLTAFDHIIGLSRLKAIHLNDSKNSCGAKKDRHACLGQGEIGLDALLRVVRHPALRHLPINLETPNDLPGYQAEIKLLRSECEYD